jgi:para-aminobenzoate synthetase/4-amino-4-deoxychorismate lyase
MIEQNEIVLKTDEGWMMYSKPHKVFVADHLRDVLPSLREIEDRVNRNGWHAAGFLSYESAPAFDEAHQTRPAADFPLLWFGLYPEPRPIPLPKPDSARPALNWSPTVDRTIYNSAIDRVRDHIAQGRTYQVNYTMRLTAEFKVDPWDFFLRLAQTQNNHAACIDTGRYVICSASPELFFQLEGETLTCRPMKGTTHRGRTTREDQAQAQWLKDSEKNRAENVMIVDMVRNDLGRIAKTGSVHVPELFAVEKYPTIWQMTSTIKAQTDSSLTHIFQALFPCASITGAPKVKTMQIISELETTPRNIYTGSIGYMAPNREAKFNVAIRTALIDRETDSAEYGVGGGIVWDSTSADEYEEALLKTRVLTDLTPGFSLFETMLWTPREGFFLRDRHTTRLLDSAAYFEFKTSKSDIESYFDQVSTNFTTTLRVRVLLDKNGSLGYETKPIQPLSSAAETSKAPPILKTCLANQPVNSENIFLFHKTTHREVYDAARSDSSDYGDILLYNERGELTEFTLGNLVVEKNGRQFTPPLSCGLLAGTFRDYLLETGQVEEGIIRLEDLGALSKIFLVNSVRKWKAVELIRE